VQGHVWAFAGWSNGGSAVQDYSVPASAAETGVLLIATYSPVEHVRDGKQLNVGPGSHRGRRALCITP
jgi:hypothetical protein